MQGREAVLFHISSGPDESYGCINVIHIEI